MYSTYNEGKSVVAERFIRTLKSKLYKHMTAIGKTKRNVTTLVNNLNYRINNLKIKDYAKKTSLSGYILTSTFNTKSTELENKIKDAVTKANTVKSDLNDYAKKNSCC